jgi:hypothetical protein
LGLDLIYLWYLDCYFTYVKFFGHPNYSCHDVKIFLELTGSNWFFVLFLEIYIFLIFSGSCQPAVPSAKSDSGHKKISKMPELEQKGDKSLWSETSLELTFWLHRSPAAIIRSWCQSVANQPQCWVLSTTFGAWGWLSVLITHILQLFYNLLFIWATVWDMMWSFCV